MIACGVFEAPMTKFVLLSHTSILFLHMQLMQVQVLLIKFQIIIFSCCILPFSIVIYICSGKACCSTLILSLIEFLHRNIPDELDDENDN